MKDYHIKEFANEDRLYPRNLYAIILSIFLLIIFGNITPLFSQDCYIVLKVKGTIILESTGEKLEKDSRVCSVDEISFGSKDAVAILYNSSNGRFTLKPNKSSESEFSGMIKTIVSNVLSSSRANVDTRGEEYDIKKVITDPFYAIGSNTFFPDLDDYPLNDKNYFLIRYDHSGKTITSRLNNTNNSFSLDLNTVYSVDGNLIDQNEVDKVTLYYFNEKEIPVKTFTLRFPDTAAVISELTPYISELKSSGKNNEEIINEILYYVYDVYGPFSPENLRRWVSEHFDLGY